MRGRVVSGDCSPETPTEPDVQVFRIRLFDVGLPSTVGPAEEYREAFSPTCSTRRARDAYGCLSDHNLCTIGALLIKLW